MAFFASCQPDFHQISVFSERGVLCKVTVKHGAILPWNKHAVALHLKPHIMCKMVVLKRSVCICGCNAGCHSVLPTVSSPNIWRHFRLLLFHIAFNVLSLPGKREHGVLCSEILRFQVKWWKMFPQSSAWKCFKVFVEKHICSLKLCFLSTYGSRRRLPMKTDRTAPSKLVLYVVFKYSIITQLQILYISGSSGRDGFNAPVWFSKALAQKHWLIQIHSRRLK